MHLIVENVRGFSGRHEIPIKPLTVLVGENSAGKSTLLAIVAAVFNPEFPFGENLFNRAPFELGSFDTIATYKGGKYGRADNFTIGYTEKQNKKFEVTATFINYLGAPRLKACRIHTDKSQLIVDVNPSDSAVAMTFTSSALAGKEFKVELLDDRPFSTRILGFDLLSHLFLNRLAQREKGRNAKLPAAAQELTSEIFSLTQETRRFQKRVVPLAPLRTKPHRTYDELIDEFNPGGDHVPLILARTLTGMAITSPGQADKIVDGLQRFGQASGLFSSIQIKRMGKRPSDPFQVMVKGRGPSVNLVDVGYGVSQALPIVVDAILASARDTLLVQQPEVHLHPMAQAALGTFFAQEVSVNKKNFVIETHSDYLLDRIRINIAESAISEDKVQVLFLERANTTFRVHPIGIDSHGSVVNAPKSYRSFFMQEEMALLTRGEKR